MSYFPPYIDGSGLHMPTYEDRLQDLCSAYRSLFGQEAELSPEVPDYQLLSVFARALDDTSALVLSAYNSRNPQYASGQALDLLLPQYGITRQEGETDAEVRKRMNLATSARGIFSFSSMEAAILEIPNVDRVMIRVNEEDTEADGIPPHTLSVYVLNGNANRIAEAIWRNKPPGIGTAGTVSRTVTDDRGNPHTVRFNRPLLQPLVFYITLSTYDGFDESIVCPAMKNALDDYVNNRMEIGETLNIPSLYGLLYQSAGAYANTFAVTDLSASGPGGVEHEVLVPAWNEKYVLMSTDDVQITVDE